MHSVIDTHKMFIVTLNNSICIMYLEVKKIFNSNFANLSLDYTPVVCTINFKWYI